MDSQQRLQLSNMIKSNNVEDETENIRKKRHSELIKTDIDTILRLKREYSHISKTNSLQFNEMLEKQSPFLFQHYTDIFNRIKKDELNLEIMDKFLNILRKIENSEIEQHEGAFLVGKYLKEIYIDSALQRGEKLNQKYSTNESKNVPHKNISWVEFKEKL
jgi:hypothetical protein